MVFKKLLGALGVGGPSVDTVLSSPRVQPGGVVTGEVRVTGGTQDVEIEHVALGLLTRVGVEHGDHEGDRTVEFHRAVVAGRFRLAAGQNHVIPFSLPLPWEAPVTEVLGQHLHGMNLGVRTELAVAKAVDKGDLDPLAIVPLPSQQRVLEAFSQLGFRFRKADLEQGRIHGVHQELPFYQEIEFYPPPQFAGSLNEVELTFVTSPHELVVVLEADKRGGFFSSGQDAFGRFHLPHAEAVNTDWASLIGGWLQQVGQRRQQFGGHSGGHGGHGYGGHGGHHGGMGGVVAGAAAGVVGGMVLGEVFEEAGEEFFGEEE
jgi:sporulation-control protein